MVSVDNKKIGVNISFDDLELLPTATETPQRTAASSDHRGALDLAERIVRPSLAPKREPSGPLLARPGEKALTTRFTDTAAPLREASALLEANPAAAKLILSSVQRASGARADYKVDLTAVVAGLLRLEQLGESPAPLGAVSLTMTRRDGMDLHIERLECLLDLVRSIGTFLQNMADPALRRRYIAANSAAEPGEVRSAAADAAAVQQVTEGLTREIEDKRVDLKAYAADAEDLINSASFGLMAAAWQATGAGLVGAPKVDQAKLARRIEADRRAMQWPYLPAFLPKFFAAYAVTYESPAGAMLAVYAWKNKMVERTSKTEKRFAAY